MNQETKEKTDQLRQKNIIPRLQIIRVGERTDDVYYQKSLEKACEATGIDCSVKVLMSKSVKKGLKSSLLKLPMIL